MNHLLQGVFMGQNGTEPAGYGGISMIVIWVAVIAVIYFLLIRPQQKQQKQHKQLISELKTGDHIVTIGGFKGVITKVKDNSLKVRFAPEVELEIVKSAVGRRDPDFSGNEGDNK